MVVASEHHLCADLQAKLQVNRELLFLELAVHGSFIDELIFLYLPQSLKVDLVCRLVDGSQRDDSSILCSRNVYATVEMHDVLWCHLVHTHVFQDVKEVLVILTVHLAELYLHQSHALDGI